MKRTLAVTWVSLVFASAALAHEGHHPEQAGQAVDAHAKFKKLTVAEVAELKQAGKLTVVDANGKETRAKWGSVPGAILLTSSSQFEPAKELPASKGQALVFYCSNPQCMAAPGAAQRAADAGYTDVAVMPEGIQGWAKSGQPTDKPAATPKS